MIKRRESKEIDVGGVKIGGGSRIVVQSMTKTNTRDIHSTVNQINELEEVGCEIVRLAVPDNEAAVALKSIKNKVNVPLVADIHFDYRLALLAIEAGVDGLRLNPGNIGEKEKIQKIASAAKKRNIPIRIGVNSGSMPKYKSLTSSLAQQMVDLALGQIKFLEDVDFDLIKVSLKSFDVPTMIEANRLISNQIPYPLHLGTTEAGPSRTGVIRSSVALGILLDEGIGDTIRVSLTADPKEEVFASYEILKSLNLRSHGPVLVSCPMCSRAEVDIIQLAERVAEQLVKLDKPIRVAVMGCAVNGPGEAKEADIGIACGKRKGLLFRKGKKLRTVKEASIVSELMLEVNHL
jgi:(E)-4-hydroxy-3-methylbut-2-enyl-diphosphate synthase